MDKLLLGFTSIARGLEVETCFEFDPGLLIPEQRVRDFCLENKCGNYGNNYMCPPYIGSLAEIEARLSEYKRGVLVRYTKALNVKEDRAGVRQTKLEFHNKILEMEDFLEGEGIVPVWGMIGGSCTWCGDCCAKINEPCPFPEKARTSLESIAIDVLAFLDKYGLDNRFHPDRITWTGCILF